MLHICVSEFNKFSNENSWPTVRLSRNIFHSHFHNKNVAAPSSRRRRSLLVADFFNIYHLNFVFAIQHIFRVGWNVVGVVSCLRLRAISFVLSLKNHPRHGVRRVHYHREVDYYCYYFSSVVCVFVSGVKSFVSCNHRRRCNQLINQTTAFNSNRCVCRILRHV